MLTALPLPTRTRAHGRILAPGTNRSQALNRGNKKPACETVYHQINERAELEERSYAIG